MAQMERKKFGLGSSLLEEQLLDFSSACSGQDHQPLHLEGSSSSGCSVFVVATQQKELRLHRSYGTDGISIRDAAKATLTSFDPRQSSEGSEFTNPTKVALTESAQLWGAGNEPLLVSIAVDRSDQWALDFLLTSEHHVAMARAANATHQEILASRGNFRYYRFHLCWPPEHAFKYLERERLKGTVLKYRYFMEDFVEIYLSRGTGRELERGASILSQMNILRTASFRVSINSELGPPERRLEGSPTRTTLLSERRGALQWKDQTSDSNISRPSLTLNPWQQSSYRRPFEIMHNVTLDEVLPKCKASLTEGKRYCL
jgi:hypothetical protein